MEETDEGTNRQNRQTWTWPIHTTKQRHQTMEDTSNGSRRIVAPQCAAPELGLRCYHAQGKDWDKNHVDEETNEQEQHKARTTTRYDTIRKEDGREIECKRVENERIHVSALWWACKRTFVVNVRTKRESSTTENEHVADNGAADPGTRTVSQVLHRLVAVTIFCLVFMVVEVAGGIYAKSLAILTDAAHLMSDVASFLIALAALWATSLRSSDHHSYGYHRAEIIGALFSVVLVWIVTAGLVVEAVRRLIQPHEVDGFVMFVIACCGILVNIGMAIILHGCGGSDMGHLHGHGHSHGHADPSPEGHHHPSTSRNEHGHSHGTTQDCQMGPVDAHAHDVEGACDHTHATHAEGAPQDGRTVDREHRDPAWMDTSADAEEGTSLTQPLLSASQILHTSGSTSKDQNMNLRGAAIHVLGDLVQSVGVAVAGALIWWKPHWVILDPICTFMFSVLVVLTTKNITRDIFDVLMERVPRHIDMEELGRDIVSVHGVKSVHDLHVWSLTLGRPLMSTHLDVEEGADPDLVLDGVQQVCQNKWGLMHTTIQIDRVLGVE